MYEQEPSRSYHEPPQLTAGITGPVLIPMWQSLITGIMAGITAGVLAAVLNTRINPWAAGAVAWCLATLASWLSYRGRWQGIIEAVLQIDLNQDGTIGQPQPAPAGEPGTRYLTPVWVPLTEGPGHQRIDVATPKDDTLARMAVILLQRGWDYFTADNFTNARSETRLMTRDVWDNIFLPGLITARCVNVTEDSRGRKRIALSDHGKDLMRKVSGRAEELLPTSTGELLPMNAEPAREYAKDFPYPTRNGAGVSHDRKSRQ